MTNTNKKSKNTRKLLGAIGMLSVSAAMLVSSTFAWFTMNRKVTAQTMTISAKSADPILQISANGGSDWYNSLHTTSDGSEAANWTMPASEKLKLVTPTGIGATPAAMTWGWASSTKFDDAQGSNDVSAVTMTTPTFTAGEDKVAYLSGTINDLTDKYVLYQEIQIKNVSPDVTGTNLEITDVKIDTGNSTNTIKESVRVLFVSDGKYAMYKMNSGNDSTAAVPTKFTTAADVAGKLMTDNKQIAATIAPYDSSDATTVKTVHVYVFFDGTDASANTANATDLDGVSVEFAFKINDEIQGTGGNA